MSLLRAVFRLGRPSLDEGCARAARRAWMRQDVIRVFTSSFSSSSTASAIPSSSDHLGILKVVRVDHSGTLESLQFPLKQLMKAMHARDILALGVSGSQHDPQRRSSPLLLPRGNAIFVSFGNIKAIIQRDSVTALEPHRPVVSAWLQDLSDFLSKYGISSEQSFQLFILEDILKEMCNTFDRRMVIYGPLVNNLLLEVDSSLDASEGFQKLLPLKDALYKFEMTVKEAQRCILDLLDHEEDMNELMEIAPPIRYAEDQNGRAAADSIQPDDAESILENYALRLSHCLNDILYLQQKVNSQQEIVELGMQIQRNRLLWANLHLGVMTVCMGFCTLLAGFFGMNIVSGLETAPYAFVSVVSGSIGSALVLQQIIMKIIGNSSKVEKEHYKERRRLNSVLEDIPAVDMATKAAFSLTAGPSDEDSKRLTQDEFLSLLERAKNISPEDRRVTYEAILELFTTNNNGSSSGGGSDRKNAYSDEDRFGDGWVDDERDEFSGVLPPINRKK